MALYTVEWRSLSHRLDTKSKTTALKACYDLWLEHLGPQGVTRKVFAKDASVVRQKVVKVETWVCPVDGQRFGRKEFVSHVRGQHQY